MSIPWAANGVSRLWVAEGNRNGAWLGPSRATQKQCLVGLKQGETKRTEVEDLQPTFQ
jgi:hypothetical protein